MPLLIPDSLADLIRNYPGLTQERRQFIVDWLQDIPVSELDTTVESYADCMPADEFMFIQECLGQTGSHQLPVLTPSEQPLLS